MSAPATSSKRKNLSCPAQSRGGERRSQSALGGAILVGSGQPGDVSALDVRRPRLTLTSLLNKPVAQALGEGVRRAMMGGRGQGVVQSGDGEGCSVKGRLVTARVRVEAVGLSTRHYLAELITR